MKFCPVGAEVFIGMKEQTDIMEPIVAFRNTAKELNFAFTSAFLITDSFIH